MNDLCPTNDNDQEPLVFCANCYSLGIRYDEQLGSDYCNDCGCTTTIESSFEEWEQLYERRYGHKFVEQQKDPKKTYVFKTSLDELKKMVYTSRHWAEIIYRVYPDFPKNLGKTDSILLFFDRLIQKNQLDSLRLELFKTFKWRKNGRTEN